MVEGQQDHMELFTFTHLKKISKIVVGVIPVFFHYKAHIYLVFLWQRLFLAKGIIHNFFLNKRLIN